MLSLGLGQGEYKTSLDNLALLQNEQKRKRQGEGTSKGHKSPLSRTKTGRSNFRSSNPTARTRL